MLTPRIHTARAALASWLNQNAGDIRAELNTIEPGAGDQLTILGSYTGNVDVGMFPLVFMDQAAITLEWHAMNAAAPIAKGTFEINIYAGVHGYKDVVLDDLTSALVGSVMDTLNTHHMDFVADGHQFLWHETMPAPQASFGQLPQLQGAIVNGAIIPISLSWIRAIPQDPSSIVVKSIAVDDGQVYSETEVHGV